MRSAPSSPADGNPTTHTPFTSHDDTLVHVRRHSLDPANINGLDDVPDACANIFDIAFATNNADHQTLPPESRSATQPQNTKRSLDDEATTVDPSQLIKRGKAACGVAGTDSANNSLPSFDLDPYESWSLRAPQTGDTFSVPALPQHSLDPPADQYQLSHSDGACRSPTSGNADDYPTPSTPQHRFYRSERHNSGLSGRTPEPGGSTGANAYPTPDSQPRRTDHGRDSRLTAFGDIPTLTLDQREKPSTPRDLRPNIHLDSTSEIFDGVSSLTRDVLPTGHDCSYPAIAILLLVLHQTLTAKHNTSSQLFLTWPRISKRTLPLSGWTRAEMRPLSMTYAPLTLIQAVVAVVMLTLT